MNVTFFCGTVLMLISTIALFFVNITTAFPLFFVAFLVCTAGFLQHVREDRRRRPYARSHWIFEAFTYMVIASMVVASLCVMAMY